MSHKFRAAGERNFGQAGGEGDEGLGGLRYRVLQDGVSTAGNAKSAEKSGRQ